MRMRIKSVGVHLYLARLRVYPLEVSVTSLHCTGKPCLDLSSGLDMGLNFNMV